MKQRLHASPKASRPHRADPDPREHAARYASILALQRTVGNQRLARLLAADVTPSDSAGRAVLHRDVDSAARALFDQGYKTVKKSDLKGKFGKTHGVTDRHLAEVQARLDALREERGPTVTHEVVDLTDPANWPTEGGMAEDEARAVAQHYGWVEVTDEFDCTDRAHTPKGRVYVNDEGGYLGADNTGHVGWGFKIWTKVRKGLLRYDGNMTWDGTDWRVNSRGT